MDFTIFPYGYSKALAFVERHLFFPALTYISTLVKNHLNIYIYISIYILLELRQLLQWGITSHWSKWPSSKNLQTINAGGDMEKREPSHTVGGNVYWYIHYGELCGDFCKKLGIAQAIPERTKSILTELREFYFWTLLVHFIRKYLTR